MKNYLTGLVLLALITGCGGGSGDDKVADAQESENQVRLESLYAPLVGMYKGEVRSEIENKDKTFDFYPVEVQMRMIHITEGFNEGGKTRIRPVLQARIRRLDAIGDIYFEVVYYPETGRIIFSTSGATAGRAQANGANVSNVSNIIGTYSKGTIVGDFLRNGVNAGKLTVNWESGFKESPLAGSDIEYRKRVREFYSPVVGRYRGLMKVDGGNEDPEVKDANDFWVTLNVSLVDHNLNGSIDLTLVGFYIREEYKDSGAGMRFMPATYFPENGSFAMTSPSAPGTTVSGGGFMSISGFFEKDRIWGAQAYDQRSIIGRLYLKKIGSND